MHFEVVQGLFPNVVVPQGNGGKEQVLLSLFPGYERRNGHMYDVINPATGHRIEFKATKDPRGGLFLGHQKYVDLTDEEKTIDFKLFIYHEETGEILIIITLSSEDIARLFVSEKVAEACRAIRAADSKLHVTKSVQLFPKLKYSNKNKKNPLNELVPALKSAGYEERSFEGSSQFFKEHV